MTSVDFMAKLNEKGIETTVDEDGTVTMLLPEGEYDKHKKYKKIVAETGWKRSWGKRIVK